VFRACVAAQRQQRLAQSSFDVGPAAWRSGVSRISCSHVSRRMSPALLSCSAATDHVSGFRAPAATGSIQEARWRLRWTVILVALTIALVVLIVDLIHRGG
jgi:hypothetical protein